MARATTLVGPRPMFRHEGSARSDRQNRLLAGYLAFVAGFVNSAGFIYVGSFTSHVTGNVGRLADDTALGQYQSAFFAGAMVLAFFVGAFFASMLIESNPLGRRPYTYGALMLIEAALLITPIHFFPSFLPRPSDVQAAVLCFAMGMQNSYVTRLSGAVVRTTHLTGVLTDLGIEAARWFRYFRALASRRGVRLLVRKTLPERPHFPKMALLITVFSGFVFGSGHGALLAVLYREDALLFPAAALAVGGVVALLSGRELVGGDSRK
jgi:uncharacterized membrane protein YoaK (UPF0700 family)